MSWNRFFGRTSLKFKITLSYALLFAGSALLIFVLYSKISQRRFIQEGDQNALLLAAELQQTFFLGGRNNLHGEFVELSELPEKQMKLIKERYPDALPLYLHRITSDNEKYYTCYVIRSGGCYEIQLSGDDLLFSRRLNPSEGDNRLMRAFRQYLLASGRENSFFMLYDTENKPLSAYPPAVQNFSLALPETGSSKYVFSDQTLQQAPFRVLIYAFPDGKKLVFGRNISALEKAVMNDLVLFIPLVVLLTFAGSVVGYFLARQFTGGLKKINDTIDKIAAGGDYSYRIDTKGVSVELRAVIGRFNRLNNKTEKLMRELRLVTDSVAHDLRTPLTRMSGALELALTRPRDKADYYEACIDAAEECSRMRDLVNTMLEITRTNVHPDAIKKEPVSLTEVLTEVHELLLPIADDKNIDFQLRLPEDPCIIEADRGKIPRVISNLLDNALKFTPEGGTVSVRLYTSADSCRLRISDSGCGISKGEMSHIFERFYRADASRAQGGFGLGLAFVKSVITAHNWNIRVASEVGKGTTFTIYIPVNNSARKRSA